MRDGASWERTRNSQVSTGYWRNLILHVACGALADDWSECQYVPSCRWRTASCVTKEVCQSLCIRGERTGRPEASYQPDLWQPKTTFSSTFHTVLSLFSRSFSSFSYFMLPKHLAGSRGVSLLPPDCRAHAVVWQGTDCMNVGQFSRPQQLCFDNPCDSSSWAEALSAVNKERISFSCERLTAH